MLETKYLIWSNNAGAWWGPGGHGYRASDIWAAGRFTRDEAINACGLRTWPTGTGKQPPEVPVPAPENGQAMFTLDQIRSMPRVMSALVEYASREATAERARHRKACRRCRSANTGIECICAFRCGWDDCLGTGVAARHIFDRIVGEVAR